MFSPAMAIQRAIDAQAADIQARARLWLPPDGALKRSLTVAFATPELRPPAVRLWRTGPYTEWREPPWLLDVDRVWVDAHMTLAGRRRDSFGEHVAAVAAVMASTGISVADIGGRIAA
jgi:hypothetical protein